MNVKFEVKEGLDEYVMTMDFEAFETIGAFFSTALSKATTTGPGSLVSVEELKQLKEIDARWDKAHDGPSGEY